MIKLHLLIFKFFNFKFPLVLENLPVNGHTQVGVIRLLSLHLGCVKSLFADVILVPLLHLSPHVKHKHGFVVLIPRVLDSSDVETRDSYDARNNCEASDHLPKFLWLLVWVQSVSVENSLVDQRRNHSEDGDQEKEHGNGSTSNRRIANG